MALPFHKTATRPPRRRASFLTQEEIIAAAALVLERDGYDALNMRSVAAELGVRAAALYRHVESRAELDDLLFDHLMADCAPQVRGIDWREDLMLIGRAWHQRLVSRRDATRIAFLQVSIGPNIAPLIDATLDALCRSGLGDSDVLKAFETYVVVVHGFASAESLHHGLSSTPTDDVRSPTLRPEWTRAHPALSRFAEALSAPADFEADFAFGLEALIAGIERRLAASP